MLKKIFCILFACLPPLLANSTDLMQSEIKHVVIVMVENRSFDNIMAWLYDKNNPPTHFIPTETDPNFIGLSEDNLDQYTNSLKNSKGEIVFSCTPIKGIPSVADTKFLNSPKFDPHEPFPNVTNQIYGTDGKNQPAMSGFLQDYATLWKEDDWLYEKDEICAVMETYTEKELPLIYGLARQYAISDLWFSSVPTQTNPNRAFSFMGTSEGETVNGFLGKNHFQSDTIWNRLTEESPSTSWSIFWQSDMTPVIIPGPYSGTNNFHAMNRIPDLHDHFQTIDFFHELARKGQLPDISYVEPQWTLSDNVSPKEKEVLHYVLKNQDAVLGLQGNDLHPPGDMRTGENFLANVYASLCSNQEAWEHTLLIITFDEHGGLFDHVVPPSAIPPDDSCQNGFAFDRYGVRVPIIFISPLIEKGTIIRSDNPQVPFDHTSLIATLMKWKNIDKSKWNMGRRVDAAPTFENVITRTTPRQDYVIGAAADPVNPGMDTVRFGDLFCLKNKGGQYIAASYFASFHLATLGTQKEKVCMEFACGAGAVNHGAFALLKSHDPHLHSSNILETTTKFLDCSFTSNKHQSSQWWTIKSLENAYTGAEIHYGDRIYIENHVYANFIQLVPARLSEAGGLFGQQVTAKDITSDDSDEQYWIIERP